MVGQQTPQGTDNSPTSDGDDAKVGNDAPGRVFSEIGPWGLVPIWIMSPAKYLPGVPDFSALKAGDEKKLSAGEICTYIALRSFANQSGHCAPFVSTIAERAEVDKSTAEKAIAKFRRLGWLTTKRRYRADGSIHRCDYYLRDTCPTPQEWGRSPDDPQGVPASSRVPHPRVGGKGTRQPEGAKNTPPEHTTRTHQGTERSGTNSARSAPVVGGNTEERSTKRLADERQDDRDHFVAVVGEHLYSHGSERFRAGTFSALAFYDAFRKKKPKPIRWPGKLVNELYNSGEDQAVDDWLLDQGVERIR